MGQPLVLVTREGCQSEVDLNGLRAYIEVAVWDGKRVGDELASRVVGLWVRFQNIVSEDLLCSFPNLVFIATSSTGVTHLPVSRMEREGVELIRLDSSEKEVQSISSTADLTWALILNAHTRLSVAMASVADGNWPTERFVRAKQLSSSTLGVAGLGRIGSRVAAVAREMGMRVVAYDPQVESRGEASEPGLAFTSDFLELFAESDFVSLHMDLNVESMNSIGLEVLQAGSGVHLVNSARGELVEEEDVIRGLEEGYLASYSADVLSSESAGVHLTHSPIWQAQQRGLAVYLSPHLGGNARDAIGIADRLTARKIVELLSRIPRVSKVEGLNSGDTGPHYV